MTRSSHPLQQLTRTALAHAGGGFDVAVVRTVMELSRRGRVAHERRNGPSAGASVEARLRALEEVAAIYAPLDDARMFPRPPVLLEVRERHVRDLGMAASPMHALAPQGLVTDMRWSSGFEPVALPDRERYLAVRENRSAAARLFTHATHGRTRTTAGGPRPTIVCIHGYRAGGFAFEERAWAMEWLFRLGLDVALFVLPFHAVRAPVGRATPLFPNADAAHTIEGFAQAMWDLRGFIAWIRARTGGPVGVAGMSLGGYTTSLLATVEEGLEFAVPFIPLGDLTDVVVDHEALRGTVVPPSLIAAGKRAMAPVRPLGRAPKIECDRVLVIGAERDGITKLSHAEQLAEHFHAPLFTFPGGHLLQFGRREAFKELARFLARRGVIVGRA